MKIEIKQGDCLELMKEMPDGSAAKPFAVLHRQLKWCILCVLQAFNVVPLRSTLVRPWALLPGRLTST